MQSGVGMTGFYPGTKALNARIRENNDSDPAFENETGLIPKK